MGGSHGSDGSHPPAVPVPRRVTRLLLALTGGVVLAVLAGLVVLWPDETPPLPPSARLLAPGATVERGEVRSVQEHDCSSAGSVAAEDGTFSAVRCALVRADVQAGEGERLVEIEVPPAVVAIGLEAGDGVRLVRAPATADGPERWQYLDLERTRPLALLAVLLAVLSVGVARLRGLAAIAGLLATGAALAGFVLPALASGEDPLAVAVVGSAAIMTVVLYVAHGVSARTTCALLGTVAGLSLCALVGWLAVRVTRLTGASSEEEVLLGTLGPSMSLSGIVLAGLVVASLGALNDVTVTQASAVWELHALQPEVPRRRLFAGALRIGRDHIASTLYTLAFAYAGAALPVLLLVELQDAPLGLAVASEQVATEVVRGMVGAAGVVLAVPVTTAIAVLVRVSPSAAPPRRRERRGRRGPARPGARRARHARPAPSDPAPPARP